MCELCWGIPVLAQLQGRCRRANLLDNSAEFAESVFPATGEKVKVYLTSKTQLKQNWKQSLFQILVRHGDFTLDQVEQWLSDQQIREKLQELGEEE